MTAQFFTSIVVNSLFLAFFAVFYDPNVNGIRKVIWGLALLFWSIGFAINLLMILRAYLPIQ